MLGLIFRVGLIFGERGCFQVLPLKPGRTLSGLWCASYKLLDVMSVYFLAQILVNVMSEKCRGLYIGEVGQKGALMEL